MYGHFLRMSGYEPIEAATGEEALELAYARVPDLILLDMSLPGIDGWEVTAELKRNETTKHIPDRRADGARAADRAAADRAGRLRRVPGQAVRSAGSARGDRPAARAAQGPGGPTRHDAPAHAEPVVDVESD